ncbi:hypothetical protein MTP99_018291 [Tenebrio molitor]|nr:hypothetical protein MTP99_018291 [Tenebrio molitor]
MQRGKFSFSCTANPSGHDDRDFSRCGRASRLGDKNRWTLLAIWHRKRSLSWGKGANESVLGVARGNVDRAVAVPDRVCERLFWMGFVVRWREPDGASLAGRGRDRGWCSSG